MEKTLHLVCDRQWMKEELSVNSLVKIDHSYGFDIPEFSSQDSWWIPQGIANRFIQSGMLFNFQAPGPYWLSQISSEFTKRLVETFQVKELKSYINHSDEKNFWKFAEAKIDSFPAGMRTDQEVLSYMKEYEIPQDSVLQKSTYLDIKNEYRFFIIKGKIMACSRYLTRKNNLELTYYDYPDLDVNESRAITAYVASIAPSLPSPEAYVLDVSTCYSGGFAVLEANPAWCSAWYGADINGVIKTILASNQPNKKWHYSPDAFLVEKYKKMIPLPFYHPSKN
jgi:hypothetical protein